MFLDIDKKNKSDIALVDNENGRLSYGELTERIRNLGVQVDPRSLVFILCRNTIGAVEGYLSFLNNDAVALTLSDSIDVSLLDNYIELYTPAYLWLPTEKASRFPYERITACDGYSLLKTGFPLYPLHDQLQFLMATSGSTGSPKLVRYKKGNLEANAKNVAAAFGWSKEERPVCDLGMQYTMGLNVINTHLYVGATVLLTTCNLFSNAFWDYIKEERATNFTGVPFSYDILFRLHFERMDLPYLTTLCEGGGKLTDPKFRRLAEYADRLGKRFIASFGTTETSARMACLPAELALTKTGSIGRAIPEGELFLVDENGCVLTDAAAEGELCYKGPNVTMGYACCKEDLLKGDDFNGVYHTGDLARRDADGCYYITGRLSRFLKLLGYRISLDQCEQLIKKELNIDCACSGTDQYMIIYITEQGRQQDVLDCMIQKTNLFQSLFHVRVIDAIMRNESGKVMYKEMDLKCSDNKAESK